MSLCCSSPLIKCNLNFLLQLYSIRDNGAVVQILYLRERSALQKNDVLGEKIALKNEVILGNRNLTQI